MNGFSDRPTAVFAAALAVAAAVATAVETPSLPPLVRSKQLDFTIPFQVPEARSRDEDGAVQRVVLQVSRDLGGTWETAGEAAPTAGLVRYRATADGEYWFRLRAVDRQGRARGGPGPDMRVLVDAAGPRLSGRVWKGADGEIVCRYAAADDSIDLESLKFEYRSPGDPGWKPVAAEGILARQTPAHMVGEEIWWAGEKVESLTVRIAVADAAGNQTVRQFSLEPTDPQVDQAALAAEIGVPPLPADPAGLAGDSSGSGFAGRVPSAGSLMRAGRVDSPAEATFGRADAGWPAERAGAWSGNEPAARRDSADGSDAQAAPRSVLVSRPLVRDANRNSDARGLDSRALDTPPAAGIEMPNPNGSAPTPTEGAAQPLEYRGRPLLLSRSRRFAWDYEVPADTGTRGMRTILWSTGDGGTSWERAATAETAGGALEVLLPGPGLYGFRLELIADSAGSGPRPGDSPETWVGVDEEPPQVELIGSERVAGDDDALVIRYGAHDTLLAPRSARILFSPHADGPWATITSHAENQGSHTWRPDRGVPARVYLRVEVADAAGNVGSATSAEPVSVAPSRFTGRLGGLKPLPAP